MTRQEYIELTVQKYRAALGACPKAGTGAHRWALATANLAARAGIPKMEAVMEITRGMSRPLNPSSEVEQAVAKAYREVEPIGQRKSYGEGFPPNKLPWAPQNAKPKPCPQAARRYIEMGDGAGEADWFGASPILIDWEPGVSDAIMLLGTLYHPDENLFIGGAYDTDVLPAGQWMERFRNGLPVPPHIIPNPMDGLEHKTKAGSMSYRCDAAVQSFRFAVAEFDEIPQEQQLAFWWGFRQDVPSLPIAALISSGGKSVHAWLRVDARNRQEWEEKVENDLFRELLVPLGCDPACRNESRLSRLPGHYRAEKGNWQRLIYLDGGLK